VGSGYNTLQVGHNRIFKQATAGETKHISTSLIYQISYKYLNKLYYLPTESKAEKKSQK